MKKTWEAPKLVVLVRAQPEESILTNCKTYDGPTDGPNGMEWWCVAKIEICDYCNAAADS